MVAVYCLLIAAAVFLTGKQVQKTYLDNKFIRINSTIYTSFIILQFNLHLLSISSHADVTHAGTRGY